MGYINKMQILYVTHISQLSMMKSQLSRPQHLLVICCLVNLCFGITFGYNLSIVSGVLPSVQLSFPSVFTNLSGLRLSFAQSAIASCYILGGVISLFGAGFVCDTIGRKLLLLASGVISIVGVVLSGTSVTFWMLNVSRFIVGWGNGMLSTASSVYATEVTELYNKERIGLANFMYHFGNVLGILLGYIMNFVFSTTPQGWRYIMFVNSVSTLLAVILSFVIPESPVFVTMVERKYQQFSEDASSESKTSSSNSLGVKFKSLLSERTNLKLLCIGIVLSTELSFSGVMAINFYTNEIFSDAGFTGRALYIAAIVLGIWHVVSSFVGFLNDYVSKRLLTLTGTCIMTIAVIALGFVLQFVKNPIARGYSSIVLICLFFLGYNGFYAANYNYYLTTIFPSELASMASSVCISEMWFIDFVVGLLFLPLSELIGRAGAFWMFGGIGVVNLSILFVIIP